MVYCSKAYLIDLYFYLKERNPLVFLYAQEIEDNLRACGKIAYHIERKNIVEDKRVCQENNGNSLQENAGLEVRKGFKQWEKYFHIVERQEFKYSKNLNQQLLAKAQQYFEGLVDSYNHFSNFVNKGESNAGSQVLLQKDKDFCQEMELHEKHQHHGEQTLGFSFQPKRLFAENNNQVPHFQTSKVEFVQRTLQIKNSFEDLVANYMSFFFGRQQILFLVYVLNFLSKFCLWCILI